MMRPDSNPAGRSVPGHLDTRQWKTCEASLCHTRLNLRGGGGGTRTPDLYSAIVAVSQLSYAPTSNVAYSTMPIRADGPGGRATGIGWNCRRGARTRRVSLTYAGGVGDEPHPARDIGGDRISAQPNDRCVYFTQPAGPVWRTLCPRAGYAGHGAH